MTSISGQRLDRVTFLVSEQSLYHDDNLLLIHLLEFFCECSVVNEKTNKQPETQAMNLFFNEFRAASSKPSIIN